MMFAASTPKRSALGRDRQNELLEPSLFRRKMEAASVLPIVPPATRAETRDAGIGGERGRGQALVSSALPARPNARQYLFHLTADARRVSEQEVRSAVVAVTPTEVERVARAVAKLRGRYLAQIVDAGTAKQGAPGRGEVEQLRQARENYEELESGFATLRAAIEAGEIPLEGVRRD